MNRVELRGGLVKDVEMVDVNGLVKAAVTLAVNGTRYDGQTRQQVVKTTYVSCEAWGIVGENLYASGVGKGCELYVVGELTQQKREGDKESHTRVAIFTFDVVRMSLRAQNAPPQENAQGGENPWVGGGQ